MKYRAVQWLLLLCFLPLQTACIGEEEYANDPKGNFEQLWRIIDEKYCFFDYKEIDWKAVHRQYEKKILPTMTNEDLFDVLSEMLSLLKDGHVNLSSASRTSYYDAWYQDYAWNFREDILYNTYLGSASSGYRSSAGLKYKILDDNVGYIRYESFSSGVGDGNLDEVLAYLAPCNGIIFDVRDNKGGNLTNSTKIAARFTNEKVVVGYIRHKRGAGHNDFSDPVAVYVEPSNGVRWQKPTVLLTNRRCYSATNDFVNAMRFMPNVRLLGDKTGGGSGLPFTSELPNGWSVRFSASPHFDRDMKQIEFGIDPEIRIDLTTEDQTKEVDTLIEEARKLLK